jgi:uncharacterized protein (DUF302 family)
VPRAGAVQRGARTLLIGNAGSSVHNGGFLVPTGADVPSVGGWPRLRRPSMRKTSALALLVLLPLLLLPGLAPAQQISIADTVLKMPLEEGVSMDDAVDSMKLRANALNFKLVAHLPLYKELQSMGIDAERVEIFQFCDARIAHMMISYDIDFSAYLPCRITLIEDTGGRPWLVTLDLDKVMHSAKLTPDLMEKAVLVRDNIREIMEAGASGDL